MYFLFRDSSHIFLLFWQKWHYPENKFFQFDDKNLYSYGQVKMKHLLYARPLI